MNEVDNILKDIKNKRYAPIYFLMGEEPFFIDKITKAIEETVLTEEEKGFNQNIVYGADAEISAIIGMAKQYPMGADRQVVIVKEAQHLWRTIDELGAYAENPQPSTVLVFNYKGKKLDGRSKLSKILKKNGILLEAKKVRDYQIANWIESTARNMGMTMDTKSKLMLSEFLGTDLGRIVNELEKLKIPAKDGKITPEIVEANIGISKDFNNFELVTAIETKNAVKAFQIAQYFAQNQKDNPLEVTMAVLLRAFTQIIIYHTLTDQSPANVAKELNIHPFFAQGAATAARNYPLKKATRIISLLRDTDVKSKGVGITGGISRGDLLNELIFKVLAL